MDYIRSGNDLFMRLNPGERLVASLVEVAHAERLSFASIVSGVGMVEGLQLAFFCVNDNDYVISPLAGVFDLSCVAGNLALYDGKPRAHVHVTLNRPDFSTLSGHLIECRCHITMEIFLRAHDMAVKRTTEEGRPATFLSIG